MKIVRNKIHSTERQFSNSQRIGFVNFSSHTDAKRARQEKMNKLFYGFPLYIEPVFRNRKHDNYYQSGKYRNMSPRSTDRWRSRDRSISSPRRQYSELNSRRNISTPSSSPFDSEECRNSRVSRSISNNGHLEEGGYLNHRSTRYVDKLAKANRLKMILIRGSDLFRHAVE